MTLDERAVDDLAGGVRAGNVGSVARAITWCESGGAPAEELLARLPARATQVVGITGSPGSGKSTLVSQLVAELRRRGRTVGVVAVDPSSPLTGGALLGDRVRLEGTTGDRGVFFRSLASRGAAGGLSDATRAAATVLSAAGFDCVLIETVGAGQAEVDIMRVADTVVVVLIPGAGDEVQALKAGLMEIADVYVLNKADLPGISDLRSQVATLLHVRRRTDWRPSVIVTKANTGHGIDELVVALDKHREHLSAGEGSLRSRAGARAEIFRAAKAIFEGHLGAVAAEVVAHLEAGELTEVEAGRELAWRAGRRLVDGEH